MRAAAVCFQKIPQEDASEDLVHLEDELFPIEEHEDRHWEDEIS
jgi:hypothetical protein